MLKRSEKEASIKDLSGKFAKVQVAIVAEFNKLDVLTVTALRKKCRDAKIDYKVVPGASHFFNEHLDQLAEAVDQYLVTAIPEAAAKARSAR